jgi:hypothetical protein
MVIRAQINLVTKYIFIFNDEFMGGNTGTEAFSGLAGETAGATHSHIISSYTLLFAL